MSLATAGKELLTGATPKILERGLSFIMMTLIAAAAIWVAMLFYEDKNKCDDEYKVLLEKHIKVTERNNVIFEELRDELKKR